MDGWETLRAIRADPRTADLGVVFCTVKGRPEDTVEGWEIGCDGYIAKPFSIRDLSDEVRQVIDRSRDERQRARAHAIEAARESVAASKL
jgi:DNA-binding response OmpR family regulator